MAASVNDIRQSQRLVELDAKLPAILAGATKPRDEEESLVLADICYKKSHYVGAARLFGKAFERRNGLADALPDDHGHRAASAATLAGCGRGNDEPPADEAARSRWRDKAREWLCAELAAWEKLLETGSPQARDKVQTALADWKTDRDLAGIRDEPEFAKFPEAEKRACRALWVDVDALLKKAGTSDPGLAAQKGKE